MGDKLAFIFQALGSFFCGMIVGFVYIWQLGLLIVGCAPIIIVVGGISQKVSKITKCLKHLKVKLQASLYLCIVLSS